MGQQHSTQTPSLKPSSPKPPSNVNSASATSTSASTTSSSGSCTCTQPAAASNMNTHHSYDAHTPVNKHHHHHHHHHQQQQQQQQSGSITSLAAHHAASKLSSLASQQLSGSTMCTTPSQASSTNTSSNNSAQSSPYQSYRSRSNSVPDPSFIHSNSSSLPGTPSNKLTFTPNSSLRPVSSKSTMLPQSAQMISDADRQREAEMEHVFQPTCGQIIGERYEVLRMLGRGTFSQVLQCRDLAQRDFGLGLSDDRKRNIVAIKVIRDVARYRHAAEKEARILQHLSSYVHRVHPANPSPDLQTIKHMRQDSKCGTFGVNPLIGWFRFGGHMCLVFPSLGCSIYDFLRCNHFKPFLPQHVKHIAKQLLTCCAGLHQIGVIHADIKPENILLVDGSFSCMQVQNSTSTLNVPISTDVRICDFGTAVFDSQEKPMIVVSRSYRPVEVILGLEWSYGVDLFAIGCVLMELYSGHRLFNIPSQATDVDHLKLIESILGTIPSHVKLPSKLYDAHSNNWVQSTPVLPRETPHLSVHSSTTTTPTSSPPGSPTLHHRMDVPTLRERIAAEDNDFYDLVSRMLKYDQNQRISAIEALQHPYFME